MNDGYLIVTVFGVVAGLIMGHVMFRADYCMVAMLRDLFMFRSTVMVRFLVVQIVLSMVLLEIAHACGALSYYPSLLMGPANLSSVVGGLIFGIGMVLSGNCVVGCLYKTGTGSVLGLCTVVAMIFGALAFVEVAPMWNQLKQYWQVSQQTTLPQSFSVASGWLVWPIFLLLLPLLWRWYQSGKLQLKERTEGFIQPWKAAVVFSFVTLTACFFTGMPVGITTCYVKIGSWFEQMFFPTHVAVTAYFHNVALNYVPVFSTEMISGGAGPRLDAIAALQLSVIIGILLGAFLSARRVGEFRLNFRAPVEQYFLVVVGGGLVGFGSRLAPGCNVWHIFGGVPLLAWNSLFFVFGLVVGTWLGSKVLLSRMR
ncbi:MAG: hypothetical protein B6I37_03135 [Desulfobacteraceae bacterium 4572_35.2]|nr:MAG: hypothetical protein B6I37_03135 [Desulfobacteraceae bacterium 4572_35.2]